MVISIISVGENVAELHNFNLKHEILLPIKSLLYFYVPRYFLYFKTNAELSLFT